MIGGPLGVVAGAGAAVAAKRTFQRLGAVVRRRWLDPAEEHRAAGAFGLALEEINRRIEGGERLRDDGFFADEDNGRSAGEELLEGMLRAAAGAYEERKVPFLANAYASLAFRPDIGRPYANFLIRLIDGLGWRQVVLLGYVATNAEVRDFATANSGAPIPPPEPPEAVFAELDALGAQDLIAVVQQNGTLAPWRTVMGEGFREIGIGRARLTRIGSDLSELMRLSQLPPIDLHEIFETISRA
jgi:hypothetical protein